MFKKVLIVFLSLCSTAQALNLTTALEMSESCFYDLLIQEAELEARLARVEQAYSDWKPSLNVSFTTGGQRVQGLIASPFDRGNPRYPKVATVSLTQSIFSFGQSQANINYQKLLACAQQSTVEARRQQLFYEVTTSYTRAFEAKEIMRISRHFVDTLKEHLDAIKRRKELSDATQTDVDQATSRYELSKADLEQAQAAYINQLADLAYWTGLEVVENLEHPPILGQLPSSFETYFSDAACSSPLVQQAEQEAYALKEQEWALRAQNLPRVDLEGSMAHQSDTSFKGSESDQLTAQLVFSFPLYQGGRVKGEVRENRAMQVAANLKTRMVIQQLKRDTQILWNDLQALDQLVVSYKAAYKAALSAYQGVVKEQKVGERVYLDVLDAAQEKLDAEELLINALNQRYLKRAQLLSLANKLSTSCLEEVVLEISNTSQD